MKKSALRDQHERLAGCFFEVADREVVSDYGDPLAEHRAVRAEAGLIDLSHRGKLRLTGRDRAQFLHGMTTNDVTGLREGEGNYATMITAQGQTLADLRVYCRPDYLLVETEAGLGERVLATLNRYLISEDVTIEDVTDSLALLGLYGPLAPEVVRRVFGAEATHLPPYGSAAQGDVLIVRSDDTGEAGFLMFVPFDGAEGLWSRLSRADARVRPAGLDAFRTLRMEAGIPVYGVDIEESATPIEASLAHAVSFDKGCYIGQEVIAKMTFRGKPRRHLVGIGVEGERIPSARDKLTRDGMEIGHVTSALRSPSLNRVIAFGYVKRDMNQPGSRVEILSSGGVLRGEIVEMPFYRRETADVRRQT